MTPKTFFVDKNTKLDMQTMNLIMMKGHNYMDVVV